MKLVILLTVQICWHWSATKECLADTSWAQFATSQIYADLRMQVCNEVPWLETPLTSAKTDCSRFCALNQSCNAFNFYKTEISYVCELLPDNLCSKSSRKAFINWPGGLVVDKLSPGMSKSCFETNASATTGPANYCKILQPDCLGVWPNCTQCAKSCIDCRDRYQYTSFGNCTMWPEGNGPFSIPIFGECMKDRTYFARRIFTSSTGVFTVNYTMAVEDMHRLTKLNAYPLLAFYFATSNKTAYYNYQNFSIGSNGTLANMKFYPVTVSSFDIFNLKGQALNTPFVTVVDDRFGCGSFWLLDPRNATYCPGGNISLFGSPTPSGVNTGMRVPTSTGIESARSISLSLALAP